MLNGPSAITGASQSVLYNAIAYALKGSSESSQNAVSFIHSFFLDPDTKMNPNLAYGQVVRGPGKEGQSGTFTGILDLRGLVKVVNAIMVLKAAKSDDWTQGMDAAMHDWMAQYSAWIEGSSLGRSTSSRPK
jgi:hypothetical protein